MKFKFSRPDYFTDSEEEGHVTLAGVTLTLDSSHSAGVTEFNKALCTAPNIKQQYVTQEWVENHYR